MGPWFPLFQPGEEIGDFDADGNIYLNQKFSSVFRDIVGELKRRRKIAGSGAVTFTDGPEGRSLGLNVQRSLYGKLAGSDSPYTFRQQRWTGTAWADQPDGVNGTAYEANGLPKLDGKVVRLVPGAETEWLFQWYGVGCANSVVRTTTQDCAGPLSGVAVTVYSGGAITALKNKTFGTGYTSQPSAYVTGDGSCAVIGVTWSPFTSGGSTNTAATSPGTGADDAGSGGAFAWSNPGNCTAADGANASVVLNPGTIAHWLKATNFGFSIPSGATIDGIVAEVKWSSATATLNTVKLVVGGSVVGSNKSTGLAGGASSYKTYGGSADKWGLTPSVSDVNASNFGLVFGVSATGFVGDTVNVDHIRITVYYTTASSGGITDFTIIDGGLGYLMPGTTITICGGGGTGASVDVDTVSSRTTESSCTTAVGVQAVPLKYAGAGYTNGTGYSLSFSGGGGSGAAGTFDVVGGVIVNPVITSTGSGYTSAPAVSFPGAGTPTTAAIATTTIGASCDNTISVAGKYLVRGVAGDGRISAQCLDLPCPYAGVALNMGYYDFRIMGCDMGDPPNQNSFPTPLEGATVTIFNGCRALSTGTSDASGIAKVPIPFKFTPITSVEATYHGVTQTLTVSPLTLKVCNPFVIQFVTRLGMRFLSTCSGGPLPGVTISCTQTGGVTLGSATSDSDGWATLDIDASPLRRNIDLVDFDITGTPSGFQDVFIPTTVAACPGPQIELRLEPDWACYCGAVCTFPKSKSETFSISDGGGGGVMTFNPTYGTWVSGQFPFTIPGNLNDHFVQYFYGGGFGACISMAHGTIDHISGGITMAFIALYTAAEFTGALDTLGIVHVDTSCSPYLKTIDLTARYSPTAYGSHYLIDNYFGGNPDITITLTD